MAWGNGSRIESKALGRKIRAVLCVGRYEAKQQKYIKHQQQKTFSYE